MELTFFSVLTLIFITLKLTSVIAWSWVWVLSPLWLPLAVLIFIGMMAVCIKTIVGR